MVQYHGRSKRLSTGAIFHKSHKKKKSKLGRPPIETQLGELKNKHVRTRGGNDKIKVSKANKINVTIKSENVTKNVEITNVDANPASPDYQRRHIITKGAVVSTELGKVRVSSRPGQTGIINGILIEE